jgi:hypothetical protein
MYRHAGLRQISRRTTAAHSRAVLHQPNFVCSDPRALRGSVEADYQRRERQRQKKNDEARPSPEAAREEFFPGV